MEVLAILGSFVGAVIGLIVFVIFIAMYFKLESINATLKRMEKQKFGEKSR
jgi:hypothetical protein